jgi:hypothetical protein
MLQEERQGPDLLIGEETLPRGHAGPPNAVLDYPKRIAFGIIL